MTSECQPSLSPQQNCLSHAQPDSFFPIPLFLYGLTIPVPDPQLSFPCATCPFSSQPSTPLPRLRFPSQLQHFPVPFMLWVSTAPGTQANNLKSVVRENEGGYSHSWSCVIYDLPEILAYDTWLFRGHWDTVVHVRPQNLRETWVTCRLVSQDQQDDHGREVRLCDGHAEEPGGLCCVWLGGNHCSRAGPCLCQLWKWARLGAVTWKRWLKAEVSQAERCHASGVPTRGAVWGLEIAQQCSQQSRPASQ